MNIGDRVKFSRTFLRSTFQFTGWQPFATGTILSLEDLGGLTLATVDWGKDGVHRSNVKNLILASRVHLEPV